MCEQSKKLNAQKSVMLGNSGTGNDSPNWVININHMFPKGHAHYPIFFYVKRRGKERIY